MNLSPRDLELLRYFADGGTTKEVAKKMRLSRRTTENRIRKVKDKLGASTLFQLGVNCTPYLELDEGE